MKGGSPAEGGLINVAPLYRAVTLSRLFGMPKGDLCPKLHCYNRRLLRRTLLRLVILFTIRQSSLQYQLFLYSIIFQQAAPTEPDGHADWLLDMPVACPYKQVAALQPGGMLMVVDQVDHPAFGGTTKNTSRTCGTGAGSQKLHPAFGDKPET